MGRSGAWEEWRLCPEAQRLPAGDATGRAALFAQTLHERFCPQAEAFLTVALDWSGPLRDSFSPQILPRFSGRLEGFTEELGQAIRLKGRGRGFAQRLLSFSRKLAKAMKLTERDRRRRKSLVTSVSRKKPAHGIPTWAIVLCAGLIGVSLVLLLVGNLVTTYVPKTASGQPRFSSQRFGGVLGRRGTLKSGAGDIKAGADARGSNAFSRGTMMFRHFSRRPTAHNTQSHQQQTQPIRQQI